MMLNYFSTGNVLNNDTGLQLNNVEVLYTKVQRVYMKPEFKEERQTDLRVNVEVHAGISPVCRKSLCVILSDDQDPCFLYSLCITEDDFKMLKSQQGLLVDFENFATQLIHLLEQCQVPSSLNMSKAPKFLLLLTEESGSWSFKLVETNNFKHLCHLSLIISAAKDADVKTHMAQKIKQLKESAGQKNKEISNLEDRIKDLTAMLEIKSKDLEQLEHKYVSEKTQFHMSLQQQTNMEHERLTQAKREWQHETEKERMFLEQKHKETVKDLRGEVGELRLQNGSLKEKLMLLETSNSEQTKRIQTLEQELNSTQRELSQVRKQNSKLDVEYHDRDKTVNSLRTRVAVLEQELKDKTILITKHSEMLNDAKEQKQHLEDLLAEKEYQLQKKQTSIKGLSDELMKANEILSKLQSELTSTKSKLKLRTSIALEQEKLLDAKQKEIGVLETKIESQNKSFQEMKEELENAKESISNLKAENEEKEKTIKNNENVISWLNRRLTEGHTPLHNTTGTATSKAPLSSIQLGLQRVTNMYLNNTPSSNLHQLGQPDYMSKTNPYLNPDSTSRLQTTSLPNTLPNGTSHFASRGLISSTSTPLDRIALFNNKLSDNGNAAITTKATVANENNNPNLISKSTATNKTKTTSAMQTGLRRAAAAKTIAFGSRMKQ